MTEAINSRGHWINGQWRDTPATRLESFDPSHDTLLWQGSEADESTIDDAFLAARTARDRWDLTALETRINICREFAQQVKDHHASFARLISRETGKPLWESKTEAGAVAGKIELAISAILERRSETEVEMPGARAIVRYRPHGVLAVLGPFNLPAHLPNGHIVPAILAGNTVVFKPSELTPAVAQFMMELWHNTSLPRGVINLVQGGRETGGLVVSHQQLDGLLFTGSSQAGLHFLRRFAPNPEKILALELGGNNPLVVSGCADLRAAAFQTVLSAFITAGQRCTCARRLIVTPDSVDAGFIEQLVAMMGRIQVGLYNDSPEPFMGTAISPASAARVTEAYQRLVEQGAKAIVELRQDPRSSALLHPGLIDVTDIERDDEECFGPLLQLIRVDSLDEAIDVANDTAYGLSAGFIGDDAQDYDRFLRKIRAGIVNWNRQTTGASGRLPFGGIGHSGNHRPSGYFASDYCSYPVASLESDHVTIPEAGIAGISID